MTPYLALCLDIATEGRVIGMIGQVEDGAIPDDAEIVRMLRDIIAPIRRMYHTYDADAVAVALYESGRWTFEWGIAGMAARAPDWRVCRAAIVVEQNGDGVVRRQASVMGFRAWD